MDHYVDIQIKPDPEFRVDTLMGALCSKLHRTLVQHKELAIGISFPQHAEKPKRTLGDVLRLHGRTTDLQSLMADQWLGGMHDYLQLGNVEATPAQVKHRVVRRRQFKTNVERLRRRRAKRHDETIEQARAHIPDQIQRKVKLPFVTLRSHSNGHTFSLFVEHGRLQDQPIAGPFNTYGLSDHATVPWF